MHRTTSVPRRLRWSLLALGLLLSCGLRPATAQEVIPPPREAPQPRTLVVPRDSTQQVEMTGQQVLKEVRNENPKVIKVSTIPDNPRAVLVTGLSGGTSRLTLIDVERKSEVVEVRVPSDENQSEKVRREALEKKRQDLIELIQRTVPTAVVDPVVTFAASPSADTTVVLTGTVANTEMVQVILEEARTVFGGTGATVINGLRIGGVQLVSVEVVVAVVNRSEVRNASFNFIAQGNRFFVSSVIGTANGLGLATQSTFATAPTAVASSLAANPNLNFGILGDNVSFLGFLEALRTEGLAKILAEPRVTTLSGRPAYIISGGETPILTSNGQGAPTVTFKQFGTVVNFLPIVLGNGKIHLEVRPELSSRNDANSITIGGVTPTVIPGFNTRSTQVAVQLEDGQTLAIGGLIQNTVNASAIKVPILGDLPFVNTLFSVKAFREDEEEMLILVTPRLVDPMCCTQIPKYLPGRETRSPDDFELFLEGILEAPRGPRAWEHGDYRAAYLNSPSASVYPCAGGNGYGNGCVNGSCGNGGCLNGGCANGSCGVPTLGLNGSANNVLFPAGTATATTPAAPARTPAANPGLATTPPATNLPPTTGSIPPVRDAAPAPGQGFPATVPTSRPLLPPTFGAATVN